MTGRSPTCSSQRASPRAGARAYAFKQCSCLTELHQAHDNHAMGRAHAIWHVKVFEESAKSWLSQMLGAIAILLLRMLGQQSCILNLRLDEQQVLAEVAFSTSICANGSSPAWLT